MRHLILFAALVATAHADPPAKRPDVAAIALFRDKAVLSIDGRRRTLSAGEVSPEGVRLIAADAAGATVEVAGARIDLRLDGRIVDNYAPSPQGHLLRLAPGANGHYFVDGQINGNPVQFIVDTGASTIAISKPLAKRLGLFFRTDGQKGRVETASGVVDAYYVRFAQVKVRTLELRDVEGVVVDSDFPTVALLGQSFLNHFDMRRDGVLLELRDR